MIFASHISSKISKILFFAVYFTAVQLIVGTVWTAYIDKEKEIRKSRDYNSVVE